MSRQPRPRRPQARDEDFLRLMVSAKPEMQADILIDTNVMVEIMTIGDLLRGASEAGSAEAWLGSQWYRYRQLRARYSNLLAWWLTVTDTPTTTHGHESIILTRRLAPDERRDSDDERTRWQEQSYGFTTGIVHVVRDYVITAKIGAVIDMDHTAEDGDTEILRVCKRDNLTLITNEGLSHRGPITLNKPSGERNLRGRCLDEGVPVYTPEEFLLEKRVDLHSAAHDFIIRCEAGVMRAAVDNVLTSTGGRDVMSMIVPVYRWIMLNEVNERFAHLNRYPEGE